MGVVITGRILMTSLLYVGINQMNYFTVATATATATATAITRFSNAWRNRSLLWRVTISKALVTSRNP